MIYSKTMNTLLQQNILDCYGDRGRLWLAEVPDLLKKACNHWNLRQIQEEERLSFNYVAYAESPDFGPVVLKISLDGEEFNNETRCCREFEKHGGAKIYDWDQELCAMLLERISPGQYLFSVANWEKQLEIGIAVQAELNSKALDGFPSYQDWIQNAAMKTRNKFGKLDILIGALELAEKYFNQLNDYPAYLLHGDLHHENIIFDSGHDRWRIIDPKGVIGPKVMEAGPFIRNQLRVAEENEENVTKICRSFAQGFCLDSQDVYKAAYVDQVLSFMWWAESQDIQTVAEDEVYSLLTLYKEHC
jgi:streptomycin 6-kinase